MARCGRFNWNPEQVIAIGDGANDLQMLAAVGLPVAYHAKPAVRARVAQSINTSGLDALIEWFVDSYPAPANELQFG